MMGEKSYNLFCPLAMACEALEPRWTLLILAELWDGSTRFNEIRRGVPGISPTLLSRRLKEMERKGLIERVADPASGAVDYVRTPLAVELEPIMTALGDWSYRNLEASLVLGEPNPDYLMWQLRRTIDPAQLPRRGRAIIRFHFTDRPKGQNLYWLVIRPGTEIDLCMSDPGYDVDLYVECEVRPLTAAWMGYKSLEAEIGAGRIFLSGDRLLERTMTAWLGQCTYAAAAA